MNKNVIVHNALTSKDWSRSEVTPQPNVTLHRRQLHAPLEIKVVFGTEVNTEGLCRLFGNKTR